jgi:hypothetical protein
MKVIKVSEESDLLQAWLDKYPKLSNYMELYSVEQAECEECGSKNNGFYQDQYFSLVCRFCLIDRYQKYEKGHKL